MAAAHPLWGLPRIHGELRKLGIAVSKRTVSRLMPKRFRPPTQTWRAFLTNHVRDLVPIDVFTVPTVRLRVPSSWSCSPTIAGASFTSASPASIGRVPAFACPGLAAAVHSLGIPGAAC